jgi:translation initiation factor IF-2
MLEPVYSDVIDGHAEVRQVFSIRRLGKVAGCFIRDGTVSRASLVRVHREEQVLADTKVDSLRRFTDDVREVQTGYECGIGLEGFEDFQEGDVLESYHREAGRPVVVRRTRSAGDRTSSGKGGSASGE